MNENSKEHRLPPPAFPPGHRRHVHRNSEDHAEAGENRPPARPPAVVPLDDGLISPDEPMPARRDPIEQAFISPDDPLPERRLELAPDFAQHASPAPDEEGQVVGMDLDDDTHPIEVMTATDPHVAELTHVVTRLAEALRSKGEAGLRTHPDMSRFDASLRAYCVGYLAGRRAEDPPAPEGQDHLPADG